MGKTLLLKKHNTVAGTQRSYDRPLIISFTIHIMPAASIAIAGRV
ncbi:hypothetical protein AB9P05_17905 [Roseivirga sp. BDSF3-8]